jgi:hypothetical protein
MASKKRDVTFTSEIAAKYPHIVKNDKESDKSSVKCTVCGGIFSIASGAPAMISRHDKTPKHKDAILMQSSAQKISKHFQKTALTTETRKAAAVEGLLVYHTIQQPKFQKPRLFGQKSTKSYR